MRYDGVNGRRIYLMGLLESLLIEQLDLKIVQYDILSAFPRMREKVSPFACFFESKW